MVASKEKPATPQTVAVRPASSLMAWLVVTIAAIFGILGLIDLAGEVLFDIKGARATGEVLEFHAMSGRSRSIEASVMAAPVGVTPFRWEVHDTLGLYRWAVGESAPLLCAHIHADHVSCVLDSYTDRYLFPLVMVLFGGGVATLGSIRLLRKSLSKSSAGVNLHNAP
jgi:hypothetical protein